MAQTGKGAEARSAGADGGTAEAIPTAPRTA
jgi:hypothetical protein